MTENVPTSSKSSNQFFYKILSTIKTPKEAEDLLFDLLTTKEIQEFSNRLDIARKLQEGKLSYRDIAKENKTSTATVSRVAKFLKNGKGYSKLLKRIKK